jgi:hypothetical protein
MTRSGGIEEAWVNDARQLIRISNVLRALVLSALISNNLRKVSLKPQPGQKHA